MDFLLSIDCTFERERKRERKRETEERDEPRVKFVVEAGAPRDEEE